MRTWGRSTERSCTFFISRTPQKRTWIENRQNCHSKARGEASMCGSGVGTSGAPVREPRCVLPGRDGAAPRGLPLSSCVSPRPHQSPHTTQPWSQCTSALRPKEQPNPSRPPYLHAVFTQHWPDAGRNRVDLGDIGWVEGREPLQPRHGDLPRRSSLVRNQERQGKWRLPHNLTSWEGPPLF